MVVMEEGGLLGVLINPAQPCVMHDSLALVLGPRNFLTASKISKISKISKFSTLNFEYKFLNSNKQILKPSSIIT